MFYEMIPLHLLSVGIDLLQLSEVADTSLPCILC